MTFTFRSLTTSDTEPGDWVDHELQGLFFNDKRLEKRMGLTIGLLFNQAHASIPAACHTAAECKAVYRLFDNPKVTPAAMLAPHTQATQKRIREYPVVLCLNDFSGLDFTNKKVASELGILGNAKTRGVMINPLLAITPQNTPLGLLHFDFWNRVEDGLNAAQRAHLPIEEKETMHWLLGYRAVCALTAQAPNTKLVYIADRGCDMIDLYKEHHRQGERAADFLVRGAYDRTLLVPEDELAALQAQAEADGDTWDAAAVKEARHLYAYLQLRPAQAEVSYKMAVAPGRKSRMVTQQMYAATVMVTGRHKGDTPVSVSAILLHEINTPTGEAPVVWLLLTSLPIDTPEALETALQYYLSRWMIELFFKVLKSGCNIEEVSLRTAERLLNFIAMSAIICWRLLLVTRLARECPDVPCTVIFSKSEWQAAYQIVQQCRPPKKTPTLREMTHDVARLGGFLGRAGDVKD